MDSNAKMKTALFAMGALWVVTLVFVAGFFIGKHAGNPSPKEEAVAEEEVVEEEAPAVVEQKKEETTFGYYPSFYMKNIYYLVSAEEGEYPVYVFTDGATKVVDAYTNTKWLEEERIGKGGNMFHVKKNKDDQKRVGQLIIKDNKGRTITVYVTQKAGK